VKKPKTGGPPKNKGTSQLIQAVTDRQTHVPGPFEAQRLECHTAVLAQSGSGKSFLVGRMIEEILLKTKARIVILDPNSDFVRLPGVDAATWKEPALRQWFFPGETMKKFKSHWFKIKPVILSNRNFLPATRAPKINWGGLSDRERANVIDLDPAAQPELYWTLVLAGEIARQRWPDDAAEADYDFEHFRTVANEVCDFLLGVDGAKELAQNPLAVSLRTTGVATGLQFRSFLDTLESFEIWRAVGDNERDIADVLTNPAPRVTVIDLLSVETESERLALTSRALSALWKMAREGYSDALRDPDEPDQRVPTFLIIDEAHNLVPALRTSPAAERLAGDVVRIAAEGRKFGLFLIVVTQRPRKLDPNILSECDGLFLMKMTNDTDLKSAADLFGFLDPAVAKEAKSLTVGEVFLQGRLGGSHTIWHVAPRRTMQGGKGIDSKYWTRV
jgi:uncharacterized protein DUF87